MDCKIYRYIFCGCFVTGHVCVNSNDTSPYVGISMKKNVPWHILAPSAVACDMFLLRASAHPRGAFYMLLFTHTCPVTEFAVASHLNTANSCCHHVFLRHFRFQKCLSINSNKNFTYFSIPRLFMLPRNCYTG